MRILNPPQMILSEIEEFKMPTQSLVDQLIFSLRGNSSRCLFSHNDAAALGNISVLEIE